MVLEVSTYIFLTPLVLVLGCGTTIIPLNIFVAVTRSNIKDEGLISAIGGMGCIRSWGKSRQQEIGTPGYIACTVRKQRERWLLLLILLSFLCCPGPQFME